jgi:hypothetical protein
MPNGQQSSRMTTLSSNTLIGTARLIVRHPELIPGHGDVRHRTSMFICNRADDVAEICATMKAAETAVLTMLKQGL